MPTFTTYDGTELAYHLQGEGEPLVCVPGGAMRASAYLGDLGGLAGGRRLILLDLRGTGDSGIPEDESTYRVDHQVGDVEALRAHLGLERMDLLAHSVGGNLAQLYAAAHPERLRRTVLVTPTAWAVDLPVTPEQRLEAARLRAGSEPYDTAIDAYERILAGGGADAGAGGAEADWDLAAPLFYGRWDAAARAHCAANAHQQNEKAAEAYAGLGAFDPPATRAGLRRVSGEVLVLAAELDGNPRPVLAAELAGLFRRGAVDVQPGAGHFPWLDDPGWFSGRVERFLSSGV
ncbi:alpha/beta hydrolase [Streptomyces sp. NBC_01310]|uniref:alpha/beta fold hydrolase n=1 Tax=Streptomyces sp. NBC_01310 TaxID=2903820 RepID=UPI0035B5A683|nr:alpha/beta hydrolase [Streptomyces sp. NBC_01310]